MDIKNPVECDTIWEFIQQVLFGIPVTTAKQQLQDLIGKIGMI